MEKVYVGYVKGVHGLRGDLKIKCRFESPEKVFIQNNIIYLNEEKHKITNTKFYKGCYLVTIDNLKDINLVEKYQGYDVFIDREDLNLNGKYILNDLYDMTIVFNNHPYGTVKNILNNGKYDILQIAYQKDYMIPLIDEFIKEVDLDKKTIEVKNIEGFLKWELIYWHFFQICLMAS